jgi:hypothetical protein
MPKTGSTTLQNTLYARSQDLLANGILYPKSGRFEKDGRIDAMARCHHKLFVSAASSRATLSSPLPEAHETLNQMQRKLESERKHAKAHSVIVSSETLWNKDAFDRAALMRIRDSFPSSEFIVLAYLRPVESHSPSAYAHNVTASRRFTGSFSDHLSEQLEAGVYDYDKRLDEFAEVFGREAIRPVWLPWLNRDVLSPLREIFPGLAAIEVSREANVRTSWTYIAVQRRLNLLQRRPFRRLVRFSLRQMRKLDPIVKSYSKLENAMDPMNETTRRHLQQKTEAMLETLEKQYNLKQT